jgi:hypothetical protein
MRMSSLQAEALAYVTAEEMLARIRLDRALRRHDD